MKLKNYLLLGVAGLLLSGLYSCSTDDDGPYVDPALVKGEPTKAIVLNSGSFKKNNASMGLYDMKNGHFLKDAFMAANGGQKLGDTGQHVLVYGGKVYINIYGSKVIFVTDKNLKVISTIPCKDEKGAPRELAAYEGKVYTTLYNGYLAEIDTTSLRISRSVKVGRNPESVAVCKGKLFVANSGGMGYDTSEGYDKTVSVVDPQSLSVIKSIEVVINPTKIVSDGDDDLYLISNGNYKDVPNTLQKIDAEDYEVKRIDGIVATYMAYYKDKLYIIGSQYDANWNQVITYSLYDTEKEVVSGSFITDGTKVAKPFSISINPYNGDLYIGESDFKTNGKMHVFCCGGKLKKTFSTEGINPMGVYFFN